MEFKQDDLRDLYCQLNLESSEMEEQDLLESYFATEYSHETEDGEESEFGERVKKSYSKSKVKIEVLVSDDEIRDVFSTEETDIEDVFAGKKYKPVHLKVRPTFTDLPDQFRIIREIKGDPLEGMPILPKDPPAFEAKGRYTEERREQFEKAQGSGFLRPKEMDLVNHIVSKQNKAFAWEDSERGSFNEDFFPPVVMPTIPHTPWREHSGKIPPGIYNEICNIIKTKLAAGVYEPSNSSYRSRWFTVLKKGGKLRLVHSLEPLNKVTIAHAGLPPATEDIATQFAGRACGGMFDLYVGYDERPLAESSRDYTTFQTPFGALRLTTLPMGWTNSVPIFHDDVTFILKDEIPHVTIPYIDDVPIRGPETRYELPGGGFQVIEGQHADFGIRRFVWEHLQNVNRVLQRMKYSGGTFSGFKSVLCSEEIVVVGHRCTYEGRKPSTERVGVIERWGPCIDVSGVRSFMGTVGVMRNFIKNFSTIALPLVRLTRTAEPWIWGPDQEEAQKALIEAIRTCPALMPLRHEWPTPVILAVDTSWKAVGFYLYQEVPDSPGRFNYARFDSIMLNEREARFSQPKRELFGLRRALEDSHYWLVGARNLVIETDAKYIKGMLLNPGMGPNATINRWIDKILLYHFTLIHRPGKAFGPDGLSRRDRQPGDQERPDPDADDEPEVEPPKFLNPSEGIDNPLEFEDYKADIDTRGGYILEVACDVSDFEDDLGEKFEEVNNLVFQLQEQISNGLVAGDQLYCVEHWLNTAVVPDWKLRYDPDYQEPYPEDHRSEIAKITDERLPLMKLWLADPKYRPPGMSEKQISNFVRHATNYFLDKDGRMYRRNIDSAHLLVVDKTHRIYMLKAAHDCVGHAGHFPTRSLIAQRFWWPEMDRDVRWFIDSCQLCQERQKVLLRIPPVETFTPSIFQVLHADTMHMSPKSNGYEYIVHGRCALSSWMEGTPLRKENAKSIGTWLFEEVICRWGCLSEIVTDNGGPFVAAVNWIESKYGIKGIRISPYNSKANGKIERPHWDVRQALYKASGGDASKWSYFFHHIMWADRVTIRKGFGCSPFFMITGAHPVLPLDVIEATWLVKLPGRTLSTTELIGYRARALAKHSQHVDEMRERVSKEKRLRLLKYAEDHRAVIKDLDFAPGSLVLIRNTDVESSLDRKMKARYFGPMIVLRRNKGGAYIVCEMDGSVWQQKVAAFRIIAYKARKSVDLPENLEELIDINAKMLRALEDSGDPAERQLYKGKDLIFDGVHLRRPGDDDSDINYDSDDSEKGSDNDENRENAPRKLRSDKVTK
jgi:hypothetical protein